MAGFNVTGADKFLQSGMINDMKSMKIDGPGISAPGVGKPSAADGASFAETLRTAVEQVNTLQKSSDKATQDLATGRTDNVADVMIASEKADIALRVMVQVRNKVIDAYNEIMKMQV